MRATISLAVGGIVVALALVVVRPARVSGQADEFDSVVLPVVKGTCANCHNDRLQSGGLNVTGMVSAASLAADRPAWEKVLQRLRAGDMPPASVTRPAQLPAMIAYIERAFERADATAPADPGRMTAHRLNRNEYTNTIRDLLGVRFRSEKDFPADDSGDGFDNMADLLTVSPLLMERYLAAAERIAAWSMSTAIPAKPIEADYRARDGRIRRLDRSTIEAEHRIEFGGEYAVRFGLPGERPPVDGRDAASVTLGFWMDGALLATKTVADQTVRVWSTSIRTRKKS
jgi:mono/diheme cytochrome c family protein